MSDFHFVPFNQTEVDTLEESRNWASENPYKVDELKTDDLSFNDKGNLILGNNSFKFSGDGFSRFCRGIGLPLRFAAQSPNDLVIHNVNQLLRSCEHKTLYFTTRRNEGTIINVSPKEPKHSIQHAELLDLFHENGLKVKRVRMSDRGMNMSLSSPSLIVEPVVGDITEIGINLSNSETGFGKTAGQMLLFRLSCSNGAVVPDQFGYVERAYGSKLNVSQVTSDFFNQLQKMLESTEKVKEGLEKIHHMKLTENHFAKIWRKVYNTLSSDVESDKVIGVEANYREGIILRERARTLENRRVFSPQMSTSPQTELEAFKVFNSITRSAQNYRYIQATELESIGGEIIRLPFSDN